MLTQSQYLMALSARNIVGFPTPSYRGDCPCCGDPIVDQKPEQDRFIQGDVRPQLICTSCSPEDFGLVLSGYPEPEELPMVA